MNDYCEECHYHWQRPLGERTCPFNCFDWALFNRHRQLLSGNPRIAMMVRTWDRMQTRKQDDLLAQA